MPLLHQRVVGGWLATLRAFVAADLRRWFEQGTRARGFERVVAGAITLDDLVQPVHGRLDRTVECAGRTRVGDYKASLSLARRVHELSVLRGQALQAPLYALLAGDAAVELLGVHPDFDYDDPLEPWHVTFEGVDDSLREGFHETLRELLLLYRRGAFPFHADRHCTWCPYTAACRRNHPPSKERQEASAAGRLLAALRAKTEKKPLLERT
jgi:hypothetical protein